MGDKFYRSFEDKYRGSRELIKNRLTVYLDFVKPVFQIIPNACAIDLGCGRGEWLELLGECGVDALGIDSDQEMISGCRKLKLKVKRVDALKYLRELPKEEVAVITAFHLVEHLNFEDLRSLVLEAMRVLVPGGLLIMETPNPENILVATRNFYLDPTHQRPIPSELLSFVSEFSGFSRFKTVRLQESRELSKSLNPTLYDVLDGVSPDYAVVSQKQGAPDLERVLDPIFSKEYGLTLTALTTSYDEAVNLHSRQELERRIDELNAHVLDAEVRYADAEARVVHWHFVADNLRQELDRRINELTERLSEAEGRYNDSEARVIHWNGVADNLRQELDRRIENQIIQSEDDKLKYTELAEKNKSLEISICKIKGDLESALESNHQHWLLSESRKTHITALL